MDGFVSYKEDFEEDTIFNRQSVEVDKKWRRREGTGDIVDKSGCTVLDYNLILTFKTFEVKP